MGYAADTSRERGILLPQETISASCALCGVILKTEAIKIAPSEDSGVINLS